MKLKATVILLGVLSLALVVMPTQADFILCPGNAQCDGTVNDDVIVGSPLGEDILSVEGDDFVFGNDGDDDIEGLDGNDVLFGGLGDDELEGEPGDDILLPGPDTDENSSQYAIGNTGNDDPDGNDIINVFAGDTLGCLYIDGDAGTDIVNLIGFGPYSAIVPFGQTGFGNNIILVIDPITGGQIYIVVDENSNFGTEIINGLPSPNVTFVNTVGNCTLFFN